MLLAGCLNACSLVSDKNATSPNVSKLSWQEHCCCLSFRPPPEASGAGQSGTSGADLI
jgi:hypothetical protein